MATTDNGSMNVQRGSAQPRQGKAALVNLAAVPGQQGQIFVVFLGEDGAVFVGAMVMNAVLDKDRKFSLCELAQGIGSEFAQAMHGIACQLKDIEGQGRIILVGG